MQLTITTDYAIRIMCYLAKSEGMCSTSVIAKELNVPNSYIPKITRLLKKGGLIEALEGIQGGYRISRSPDYITVKDIITLTENTIKLNRCLEDDAYCSRKAVSYCSVHRMFLGWQEAMEQMMDSVTIADLIGKTRISQLDRFLVHIRLILDTGSYECLYAQDGKFRELFPLQGEYVEFIKKYTETFVYSEDQAEMDDFLNPDNLAKNIAGGVWAKDMHYRRTAFEGGTEYIRAELKAYYEESNHSILLSFRSVNALQQQIQILDNNMDYSRIVEEGYWQRVSMLSSILGHDKKEDLNHPERMIHYTELIYRSLQKKYPHLGITEYEIRNVSHLSPIHDIGKIQIPLEILEKREALTEQEFQMVQQHPIYGAEMVERFPETLYAEELNKYSYSICRYHHERYDGSGYPEGLKGEEIPRCAQVVGIADVYDALTMKRPYKTISSHEEAVGMILTGKCGAFSDEVLQAFLYAAMQPEWKDITG